MRATGSQSGSHREPKRARERQGEIQLEPERTSKSLREPVRARVGVTESHREPERDKKEASLTFLAYLNIVLLQNN